MRTNPVCVFASRIFCRVMNNAEFNRVIPLIVKESLFLFSPLGIIRVSFHFTTSTHERNDTMRVHFDPKAEELRHLQIGPLGPHVESFAALLSRQG